MHSTQSAWEQALILRHGKEIHESLQKSTVAICGLGGLGSNIAIALARAGVGHLICIDFDKVELVNIHRQQYRFDQIGLYKTQATAQNLDAIAPYTKCTTHCTKIEEHNVSDLLAGATVICEAFDKPEAKSMLLDAVCNHFPQTPLVMASGMAGMGSPNAIQSRKLGQHIYLCGDACSDIGNGLSVFAPRVMLCASHQALLVLQILTNQIQL